MTTDSQPTATRPAFIQALGLRDVAAMTLVGVVSLRWISRGARIGAPSILLWVLAWVAFFLPLAATVCALSARHPDQGGLYAWTRRAFGPAHGFVFGWCLWVNNLFYFPSLLLFAAANAVQPFGERAAVLADSRLYCVAFVLVMLLLAVALNVRGFSVSKWLQNIGSIGTWLPAALLIGFGAVALARFGSATSFAPSNLVPRHDLLGTVSLWSAICFAFSGFEVTSLVGQEVRDARRTIPAGVMLAGVIATVIYVAGSVSLLAAIPASALAERSGIADAIGLVSSRIGLGRFGGLTGALLALGSLAMTNAWFAAAARVPFAAGVDRALPAFFGRMHARYRTPHVALIVQGLASSLIFLASLFLSVAGSGTSIQEAYDILVNLTILVYFVPYLYLFASLVRLDRRGRSWVVALTGGTTTAICLALLFVPPEGTASPLNYEANVVVQALVVVAIGFALYRRARPDPSRETI
jgi:amino acid transporter